MAPPPGLRDYAAILICIEGFILLFVPLILLIALTMGVRWVNRKLPPLFAKLRDIVHKVQSIVEQGSSKIASPLIQAHAFAARLRGYGRALADLVQEDD